MHGVSRGLHLPKEFVGKSQNVLRFCIQDQEKKFPVVDVAEGTFQKAFHVAFGQRF